MFFARGKWHSTILTCMRRSLTEWLILNDMAYNSYFFPPSFFLSSILYINWYISVRSVWWENIKEGNKQRTLLKSCLGCLPLLSLHCNLQWNYCSEVTGSRQPTFVQLLCFLNTYFFLGSTCPFTFILKCRGPLDFNDIVKLLLLLLLLQIDLLF